MTSPGHDETPSERDQREDVAPEPPSRLLGEVTKVLRVKRWEVREGPFRGFDSPPGRF